MLTTHHIWARIGCGRPDCINTLLASTPATLHTHKDVLTHFWHKYTSGLHARSNKQASW